MHAYKLEDNFQLDIARKTELWAHAERYWLPRLGRSLEPVEAEEVLSILKGLFLRKLRTDEGIGAAIQFSKALFNEAYREYKSGSKRTKPVKEEQCPHCGEQLAKLGRGYECENDFCSMFGVGINADMLKEHRQVVSLDEVLEAGGDEVLVTWGLYTAADEDVRGDFEGERLDERLVQLLKSDDVPLGDKQILREYLAGDHTFEQLDKAHGTSARTLGRRLTTLGERLVKGTLVNCKPTVEAVPAQVTEAVLGAEVVEPAIEVVAEELPVEPVVEIQEQGEGKPALREWAHKVVTFTRQRVPKPVKGAQRRRDPGRARLPAPAQLRAARPVGEDRERRSRSSGRRTASGRSWLIRGSESWQICGT